MICLSRKYNVLQHLRNITIRLELMFIILLYIRRKYLERARAQIIAYQLSYGDNTWSWKHTSAALYAIWYDKYKSILTQSSMYGMSQRHLRRLDQLTTIGLDSLFF